MRLERTSKQQLRLRLERKTKLHYSNPKAIAGYLFPPPIYHSQSFTHRREEEKEKKGREIAKNMVLRTHKQQLQSRHRGNEKQAQSGQRNFSPLSKDDPNGIFNHLLPSAATPRP